MVLCFFLILTLCFCFCFWFLAKLFGSGPHVHIANMLFPLRATDNREPITDHLVIPEYWDSLLCWVRDNRNAVLSVSYVDLFMQEPISYPQKTEHNFQISTSEFCVNLLLTPG